mgnify:CR=1 FL=1
MTIEQIETYLTTHYKREPIDRGDEFNPYDTFGGNMDDAYYGGYSDGETQLAHHLLGLIRTVNG